MVLNETKRMGGAYIYVNLLGCDGTSLYFDGGNIIAQNGELLGLGPYHTLNEIEITEAVLNLQKIRMVRHAFTSGQRQVQEGKRLPIIDINFHICTKKNFYSHAIKPTYDCASKQQIEVIGSYLWDYLRKSDRRGFFLPLSGGSDSACVALCLYWLCEKVYNQI
jgi:NAD+ synthase (glutamine-hydrolysing)